MKRQTNERAQTDPVCGMKVSYTAAVEEFAYQGKAYYFCSSACRESFEFNPVQYLPRHRQHGIKTR